eukprot:Colp12_sorted_trinity150504_noHs@855
MRGNNCVALGALLVLVLAATANGFGQGAGFSVFRKDIDGLSGGLNTGKLDVGRKVVIEPGTNKIVVTGYSRASNGRFEMGLWRYNPDGSLDTSFKGGAFAFQKGGNGAAGSSFASKWDRGLALAIDGKGRYVIGGISMNSLGKSEATLWRFLNNGNLDTSFGGSICWFGCKGFVSWQNNGNGAAGAANADKLDQVQDLVIDPQGRIIMVGASRNPDGGYAMAMWRYNDNGTPDGSFGSNGAVVWNARGLAAGGAPANSKYEGSFTVALDSAGRIVVGGDTQDAAGGW